MGQAVDSRLRVLARTLLNTFEVGYPLVRRQAQTIRASAGLDYVNQDVKLDEIRLTRDRLRVGFVRLGFDAQAIDFSGLLITEPRWRFANLLELRQGMHIFGATPDCGRLGENCLGPGDVPPSRIEGQSNATVLRYTGYGEFRPSPSSPWHSEHVSNIQESRCSASRNFPPAITRSAAATTRARCSATRASARRPRSASARRTPPTPTRPPFEGYAFWDHASVSNHDKLFVIAASRSLDSVGGGARVNFDRFALDAGVAIPLTVSGSKTASPIHVSSSRSQPASGPGVTDDRSARPAYRAIRKKLLISCASVAIATAAVTPQKVRAQAAPPGAFQGTPGTTSGSVDYSRGAGTDTITISSPTASIDWSPYDNQTATANPIDFLPTANTATFTSSTGLLDYTVPNRIIPLDPSRAIELNGRFSQRLKVERPRAAGSVLQPGGILIGSLAVIDVGSLLLTTADPGSNWSLTADGFTLTTGTATSSSRIAIADGAQLKALQQNSYIALIAPRIEQGGNVQVNGSAAYIAGEQMAMTFSQGLFDVEVNVGTDDVNGIVDSGTTGGPANATAGDNHTIYMAAVPKNQAMTMLRAATSASMLRPTPPSRMARSSFHRDEPRVDGGEGLLQTFDTTSNAGMHITGGHFSSNVWALANADLTAETLDQPLTFDGDILLESENASVKLSGNGDALSVGGNAALYALGSDGAKAVTIETSNGGSVAVTGDVYRMSGSPEVSTFTARVSTPAPSHRRVGRYDFNRQPDDQCLRGW